jgi:transcription antitermination factor NusG
LLVRELLTAAAPRQPHFVIRTDYRADRQLKDRLLGYGFTPVQLRFLPGYIFVRFDPSQRLRIGTIAGVHSIVGFAGQPAPVDALELEALRRISESRLAVSPAPFPALGRPCRLMSGPLEGLRGVLMGDATDPRLVVSLTLLQRSIAVSILPEWI